MLEEKNLMANIHYFAAIFDPTQKPEFIGIFKVPAREIIGSLYTPSCKKAQQYLDQHYPGARALKASACTKSEQAGTYPLLVGCPTSNDRGAGRKSMGHNLTIKLCGLSDRSYKVLLVKGKTKTRSSYLVKLVENNQENPTAFLIGQQIQKDGNIILYNILDAISPTAQTTWFDQQIVISTEFGDYKGENHAEVLLMAIEEALKALNTKEPQKIIEEDDYL